MLQVCLESLLYKKNAPMPSPMRQAVTIRRMQTTFEVQTLFFFPLKPFPLLDLLTVCVFLGASVFLTRFGSL